MIKNWKLFNFKSIQNETTLEMAPLTIFAGANSSGKSTLIQSILLVTQTIAHKVEARTVVLNGVLARLGQFDDVKSVESEADQIVIGWTCCPLGDGSESRGLRSRPRLVEVSCEISFDDKELGALRETAQIQPRLFASEISVVIRDPAVEDRRYSMTMRRTSAGSDPSKRLWRDVLESFEPAVRSSLEFDVEVDQESLAQIHRDLVSAVPVGVIPKHFLPKRIVLGFNRAAEDALAIFHAVTGEGSRGHSRMHSMDIGIEVPDAVIDFILECVRSLGEEGAEYHTKLSLQLTPAPNPSGALVILLDVLNDALLRTLSARSRIELRRKLLENDQFLKVVEDAIQSLQLDNRERDAVRPFRLPRYISDAVEYIDNFFSTCVRYLGPLRDEPKSVFPLSPTTDPLDVGLKGEHTAAVLELHKNRKVRFIPPAAFAGLEVVVGPITRSLEVAVNDWLRYLGVAEHVESRDKGKLGHELTVSIAGGKRLHDLTHVGVGVSQVLPILVTCLLADKDTTLIFEQPELHLHPKVQTLLADFFLSMTQLGKQCLIETHSEYLINRVRFRAAAAAKNNPWVEAVKVYFLEKKENASVFQEVKINEYGAILDWPEGFFDQSQVEAEAILRAATSKRKANREKSG